MSYTWLVCLAEKYTKKPLSETFEIKAPHIYAAADVLKKILGRDILANEYADCLLIEEGLDNLDESFIRYSPSR